MPGRDESWTRIRELVGDVETPGTLRRQAADLSVEMGDHGANGGAKVDHGSGGMVLPRRSKTLPVCQPFPVMGRVGGFTPWSCIARSVWRAGTG